MCLPSTPTCWVATLCLTAALAPAVTLAADPDLADVNVDLQLTQLPPAPAPDAAIDCKDGHQGKEVAADGVRG